MIHLNKIKPFKCRIYSPHGKYLGCADYFEFNDLRIQIKKEQISGYYLVFNHRKIFMDRNGTPESWPNGFYDLIDNQLDELIF